MKLYNYAIVIALAILSINSVDGLPSRRLMKRDGNECQVSYYTPESKDNGDDNSSTTAADGTELDPDLDIVAVPEKFWEKYKDATVELDGKQYTVRDSCGESCADDASFSILAREDKPASSIACSWTPVEEEKVEESGKCQVSFYTDDPAENDGYTTTADGSPLDHTQNIVAVPTCDAWEKYRGQTVELGGKTYTVRDSCSVCEGRGISFDILVNTKEEAKRNGIQTIDCSWNPLMK